MGPDVENERTTKPKRAASALTGGLERMFRVVKTDHPDLVGGIEWLPRSEPGGHKAHLMPELR